MSTRNSAEPHTHAQGTHTHTIREISAILENILFHFFVTFLKCFALAAKQSVNMPQSGMQHLPLPRPVVVVVVGRVAVAAVSHSCWLLQLEVKCLPRAGFNSLTQKIV